MKANEAPNKIYLSYETDNEDYNDRIFIDYMWHRHPFEGKNLNNIEYIRADAFIEKACEWLSNMSIENMEYKYDNFDTSEGWYKMIEDFRKYMEE